MDPVETLLAALRAIVAQDGVRALESLYNLTRWLEWGGFLPRFDDPRIVAFLRQQPAYTQLRELVADLRDANESFLMSYDLVMEDETGLLTPLLKRAVKGYFTLAPDKAREAIAAAKAVGIGD